MDLQAANCLARVSRCGCRVKKGGKECCQGKPEEEGDEEEDMEGEGRGDLTKRREEGGKLLGSSSG